MNFQGKRLAKLHAKLADTRTDFLHKLSTQLIRENQTIVLEDLNVSGMVRNRKLSRAISDLGWRTFRTFLEAKSEKYGRDFRVIDRWEPTSKTCSCCGFKIGKLDLSIREWICLNCGTSHDRDINAATNILVAGGLSETLNGRGGSIRLSQDSSTQRSVNPPEFKQLSIFDWLE
jgi:putative transposase